MKKNIRSKAVSDALKDYGTLTESLRENTESAVKSLLSETVRDTYAKLLAEADDEDYDEEEVEDTDADMVDDAEVEDVDVDVTDSPEPEVDDDVEDDVLEDGDDDADVSVDVSVEDGDGQGDEWAEFDKYKMSDGEYDLSDAEDEEIVKVYKLMKDDDQIIVHNDECGKTSIKDNDTGAEYIIDMGGCGDGTNACDVADAGLNDLDDMNESNERLYELVLEDANVGYTDSYQDKDVMTNNGMEEPANKGYREWDKGLPGERTKKPWSGYPKKKADKPFTEEEDFGDFGDVDECGFTDDMEEGTNVGGYVQQNSDSKSHAPSGRRTPRSGSHSGRRVKGTVTPRYDKANESLMRRIDDALNENKDLKYTLNGVMKSLKEAAVTNHNLAQIVKLISENSTTSEEKKEIISRFAKEANTIKESKQLYESISKSLRNPKRMTITEDKDTEQKASINETTIYKSQDMLDSLDLMHRMMK